MDRKLFWRMIVPFSILVILLAILFVQNRGVRAVGEPKDALLLDADAYQELALSSADTAPFVTPPILLVADSTEALSSTLLDNMSYVLGRMKLTYTIADLAAGDAINLNNCQKIVITFSDWSKLGADLFVLCDWVKEGGQLLFAAQPEWNGVLGVVSTKLGVLNSTFEYGSTRGTRFVSDFMPLMEGKTFSASMFDNILIPMRLLSDENTVCHVVSADESAVPLLWERNYGSGRFVVNNNGLFASELSSGYIASVVSLLGDSCAYAAINGSAIYIDDFPAPIPQGYDARLSEQYGASISEYYSSVWWPDMKALADRYGLRYTGLLVETYNDSVKPPYSPENGMSSYLTIGRKLFGVNGEIGYHGYNHQSLVPENFNYEGELDYRKYASAEDMSAALNELRRFAAELFPDYTYTLYVPPSNVLSSEARQVIAKTLPEVRVISSIAHSSSPVYYVQDFDVGEDGIVNVPRISAGAMPDEMVDWTIYNELAFRMVFSHFVHPDDVLDEERGALLGWDALRNKLEEYFADVDRLHVRQMTASDLGGAVQRYCALRIEQEDTGDQIRLYCNGFLDEASLLLRIRGRTPVSTHGGALTKLTSQLYLLHAERNMITIELKAG